MGRGGFIRELVIKSYPKANKDYDLYFNRHGLVSH